MEYLLRTYKWAQYIDRDIKSQASFTVKALEYLPNRLTPLYSKIHYEEKNYLKVRTELFIYLSLFYSKGWYGVTDLINCHSTCRRGTRYCVSLTNDVV